MNKKWGWKPDIPDIRDFTYKVNRSIAILPPMVDLRPLCPPVYDQDSLGSCTGQAIAAAIQFNQIKKKDPHTFLPSRLFIYYNERVMEGTVDQDSGAMIRDGMKSVNVQGVCPETLWPYDINEFKTKPIVMAYNEGLNYQTIVYSRVPQDLYSLKSCLAGGDPIVFGFAVYQSFETEEVAKTGIGIMPTSNDNQLGGHAVLCVGYDDSKECFIIRNSWGDNWGQDGYFTLPYAYLTNNNLADDFWVIKDVEI